MAKQRDPERYPLSAGSKYERDLNKRYLARLFQKRGLSRKQLAEAVGLTSSKGAEKVSRWLEHPEEIEADMLQKLADALGVSEYAIAHHGMIPRRGLIPLFDVDTDETPDCYADESMVTAYGKLATDAQRAVTTLVGTILEAQRDADWRGEGMDELAEFGARSVQIVDKLLEHCDTSTLDDELICMLTKWRQDAKTIEAFYWNGIEVTIEETLNEIDLATECVSSVDGSTNTFREIMRQKSRELHQETEEILRETRYRGRRKQQPPTE